MVTKVLSRRAQLLLYGLGSVRRGARRQCRHSQRGQDGRPGCRLRGLSSFLPDQPRRALYLRGMTACSLWRLLGGFGVADVDGGQPDGLLVVVYAAPDTAAAGDLVLPLGQLHAICDCCGETPLQGLLALTPVSGTQGRAVSGEEAPLQGLLALTPVSGVCRDEFPCRSDVVRGSGTELLPRLGCGVVGESTAPASSAWWRGDSVPAAGHQSTAGGQGTRPPCVIVRGSESRAANSAPSTNHHVFQNLAVAGADVPFPGGAVGAGDPGFGLLGEAALGVVHPGGVEPRPA